MKRSDLEKRKYFEKHRVSKQKGFELHHIIPLSWSEDEEDFKLYDDWKNMIYISAYEYSIITQSMKKVDYARLSSQEKSDNLELSDIEEKNKIFFEVEKNLRYNSTNKKIIFTVNFVVKIFDK